MSIDGRFLAVMQFYKLNKGEFASRLGVSQGVISHISSGRNKPSLDMVLSLLESFKEVDPEWLLYEKGEMLRQEGKNLQKEELLKLIEEINILNEMNYNVLNDRIRSLKKLLDAPKKP